MKNTVNIPSSVKDINISIARRITILAEQQAVLAKTRCKVRRHSRQLHVDATRQQILELRQARKAAILVERYANQRVIEELEMILDRTKLAVNIDSIREHITSQIKLKR
jgi:hypothetical protein